MKITTGTKRPNAFRVVVYGTEGIGKTTLASRLPGALFLDLENGTHGIETSCIDATAVTFEQLMGMLNELTHDHNGYRSLVIDSLDVLEKQLTQQICEDAKVDSIEKVAAYGKGYVYLKERFGRILDRLSALAESGMNVVCIGHSQLRTQTLPDEQGAFDRYELKLQKQVAPIVKEWCDTLLFVNYKTTLVATQGETKQKATGGKRWVYAEHRPSWDAKHRASLPLPEDCSIEKATEILSKALGATGGESAKPSPKKPQKAPESAPAPAPEERPEPTLSEETIKAIKPKLPGYVENLLEVAGQYGVTRAKLEAYAEPKLSQRYGEGPHYIGDWPEDFVAWLVRGIDKIALKIK